MNREILPMQPVQIDPDSHEDGLRWGYVNVEGQIIGPVMTIGNMYEIVHEKPVLYERFYSDGSVGDTGVIGVKGRFTSPRVFSDATVVFCDLNNLSDQTTARRDRFEFVIYPGDTITRLTD